MIVPDPDLLDLLDGLAAAGVPGLARAARDAAFLSDDEDDAEEDSLFSGVRDREEQLQRASRFVMSTIDREIAITERLQNLSRELELERVTVIRRNPESRQAEAAEEDLLQKERIVALRGFASAWAAAEGEIRQSWEAPDER